MWSEAQRLRMADQLSEHAVAARKVADRRVRLFVDPEGEEASKLVAALVQNAKGGVASARQLARRVEHHLKHALQIETRDEGPPDLDQPTQPRLVEGGGHVRGLRQSYYAESGCLPTRRTA